MARGTLFSAMKFYGHCKLNVLWRLGPYPHNISLPLLHATAETYGWHFLVRERNYSQHLKLSKYCYRPIRLTVICFYTCLGYCVFHIVA